MRDINNSHPKSLKLVARQLLAILIDKPLFFLIALGLAIVALLANSTCQGLPSPTAIPTLLLYTRAPTPTPTVTPTCTPTRPTPTRIPTFTPTIPSPAPSPSPTSSSTSIVAPTSTAALTPPPPPLGHWNPLTPIPTALPGYNPHMACVVNPCAPAPQLIGPLDGAEVRYSSTVWLEWTWEYCLPPEWKFAIRISDSHPPHSYRYVDSPLLILCQDGKTSGRYPVGEEVTTRPGIYYWNIGVARSVEGAWERLAEESEIRALFIVKPAHNSGEPSPP